jgi:hypothetical protein
LTRPARVRKPARRGPLAFEPLEAREVPATFYWVGDVDHYYHKAANWTQSTDPNNKPDAMTPPPPGSDVRFDGRYSSANCFWGNGPSSHAALRLVNDYTGTLTLGPALTVESFDLQSGKVDQDTTSILTVTGSMTWTGGELDSTPATPSQVVVTGSGTVATILNRDGPGTTVLQTADTIRVEWGAELRFGYGTVNFNAAGGIRVSSLAKASVVADGATRKLALTRANETISPVVTLETGGQYVVDRATPDSPIGSPHTSQLPFLNNAGTLEIRGGVHMTVSGRLPNDGPSVRQTGGGAKTRQTCGSTLQVPFGYDLNWGSYTTIVNVDGSNADLAGNLTLSGSGAVVNFERVGTNCGTFQVLGTVDWSAGEYRPTVGVVGSTPKGCLWKATGRITVGANARFGVLDTFGAILPGHVWYILESTTEIVGGPPAAPANHQIEQVGNPVKRWQLRRT